MKNKLIGKEFRLRAPENYHAKGTTVKVFLMLDNSDWARVEPVDCPAHSSRFDVELALLEPVEQKRRFFGLLKPIPWWQEELAIFSDIAVSSTCKTRLMNELLDDLHTRLGPKDDKEAIIKQFIQVFDCLQAGLIWARKGDALVDIKLMQETCDPLIKSLQTWLTVEQNSNAMNERRS